MDLHQPRHPSPRSTAGACMLPVLPSVATLQGWVPVGLRVTRRKNDSYCQCGQRCPVTVLSGCSKAICTAS
jgi:hypothetical protein